MRKLLVGVSIAVLAGAFPAAAQEAEPVPTAPCDVPADTIVQGLSATSQSFSPSPVPSVGHDVEEEVPRSVNVPDAPDPVPPLPLPERVDVPVDNFGYHEESVTAFDYIVDVSGSSTVPFAVKGSVTLTLGWDNDSDFDLYVYDAEGNVLSDANTFNPLDGSGEIATLSSVPHCTVLHVEVVNYAGIPNSAMTLGGSLKSLKA